MPRSGSLDAGIGIGAVPAGTARHRRGPRALRLYPLEAILVAMRPPGPLWPWWALAGSILGTTALTATRSLAARAATALATLPATTLTGLAGLAGLTRLGRGRRWLAGSVAPGAVRRAGGLTATLPLGGGLVSPRTLAALAARFAALRRLRVLGALSRLLLALVGSRWASAAAPATATAGSARALGRFSWGAIRLVTGVGPALLRRVLSIRIVGHSGVLSIRRYAPQVNTLVGTRGITFPARACRCGSVVRWRGRSRSRGGADPARMSAPCRPIAISRPSSGDGHDARCPAGVAQDSGFVKEQFWSRGSPLRPALRESSIAVDRYRASPHPHGAMRTAPTPVERRNLSRLAVDGRSSSRFGHRPNAVRRGVRGLMHIPVSDPTEDGNGWMHPIVRRGVRSRWKSPPTTRSSRLQCTPPSYTEARKLASNRECSSKKAGAVPGDT